MNLDPLIDKVLLGRVHLRVCTVSKGCPPLVHRCKSHFDAAYITNGAVRAFEVGLIHLSTKEKS
jgi:hypothetical protein